MERSDIKITRRLIARLHDDCLAMQGVQCCACAEACIAGAIRLRAFAGGYGRPELDSSLCDGCGACVIACPIGLIDLTDEAA